MADGSLAKLSKLLGHHSVVVTERYSHLLPSLFTDDDLRRVEVDLAPGEAKPVQLGARLVPGSRKNAEGAENVNEKAGAAL